MVKVTFTWPHSCSRVEVSGSYDAWKDRTALAKKGEDYWTVVMDLEPGTYEYKFIVDDVWCHDVSQRFRDDGKGNLNNYIDVAPETSTSSSLKKESFFAKKQTKQEKSPRPAKHEKSPNPGKQEKSHNQVKREKSPNRATKPQPQHQKVQVWQKTGQKVDDVDAPQPEPRRQEEIAVSPLKSPHSSEQKAPSLLEKIGKMNPFQKEKKIEEPETEIPPKDKETEPPMTFKSWKVRLFQHTHSKPDPSWITSSLDTRKEWKEKFTGQVSIELNEDKEKAQIMLHVFVDNKSPKPRIPWIATLVPPPTCSKLASRNSWGWQGSENKDDCYAIRFSSDDEFSQFMEIVNLKSQ